MSNTEIANLQAENAKLKEEREREGKWVVEGQREANAEINKLKAENADLKEWVDRNQAEIDRLRGVIDGDGLADIDKDRVFGDFDIIEFEKADIANDVEYFNHFRNGSMEQMVVHRMMTDCFDWNNFDAWGKSIKKSLPIPVIPYPREDISGVYPEFADTEEQEEDITKLYFKENPALSKEAVKEFVNTHNNSNEMVEHIKNLPEDKFSRAVWGYQQLFKVGCDEGKVKIIGECLFADGGIQLMRASYYLMSWDMKKAGMLVGSYHGVVEHYWDGVGSWMA